MKTTVRLGLLGLACTAAAGTAPALAAYTATPFDLPGASFTELWDITNNGRLVGNTDLGAFVYSGGVASYLPSYQGLQPAALGISDAGVVVGSLREVGGTNISPVGFLYDAGTYTTLTVAGADFTQFRHISADGRYATGYYTGPSVAGGFVLDRNTAALTLVPNAAGVSLMILQGANAAGLVTGSVAGTTSGAVLYNAITGTTSFYGSAGGLPSPRFRDITEAGLIAGWSGSVSLVGTVAGGFETFAVDGAQGTTAQGINEAGTVVGNYTDADGNRHGFIASVPEPTSALLILAGLAWVATRRRTQR
jgi:uncharacterized membrane protein